MEETEEEGGGEGLISAGEKEETGTTKTVVEGEAGEKKR